MEFPLEDSASRVAMANQVGGMSRDQDIGNYWDRHVRVTRHARAPTQYTGTMHSCPRARLEW